MMLQNCGISIPTLVQPHLERPRYASSSHAPPVQSIHCLPRPRMEPEPILGKFSQDAFYPGQTEGNYPSFFSEPQTNRSLAVPSWTPWRSRPQNVPFLGHPYGGQPLYYGYNGQVPSNSEDHQLYPQKRKRARTTFSVEQLKKLEKRFHGNHYIVGDERLKISKDLNLSEAQVKVWFQNRRIKFKKEEELEKLGIKKKRKGAHHVKRWQVVTRNFGPESSELFHS